MTSLLDDASLPNDIPGLQAEIAVLDQKVSDCHTRIKTLMAEENPAKGLFRAAEIHEAKQLLMQLRYQKDVRVARLTRRSADV